MSDHDNEAFLDRARQRIRDHALTRRAADLTDKLYAVVQSESGERYVGVPLETSMAQFDVCAERHAISQLLYAEPEARVTAVLVASPAPDETSTPTTPCGACRHAIDEFSDDCPVYCATFVREDDGWAMFPQIERYSARELYPDNDGHPSWG